MPAPGLGLGPAAAVGALLRSGLGGLRRCRPTGRGGRWCSGAPPQPVVAAKEPLEVELKAGVSYSWCSCGHSRRQPFCDGSHRTAAPGLSPLRFTAERDGSARLCGCKRTRTPPFCDGSHKDGAVQGAQLRPQP